MDRLPADCISRIMAFTSPKDICSLAAVSSAFRSAADSNTLWETFLPADYREIIAQAPSSSSSSLLNSLSEKALYFHICDHPLRIHSGNSIIALEKESGRQYIMIAARDLDIKECRLSSWTWESVPSSRFSQSGHLDIEPWLKVKGKMEGRNLSGRRKYAVYVVFKLIPNRNCGCCRSVFRGTKHEEGKNKMVLLYPTPKGDPRKRGDGWLEIEMAQIANNRPFSFRLKKSDDRCRSCGLILRGVQIRPMSQLEWE